ncbi:hypothetical protein CPB83DRAFT_369912 [Crepidotus variabilis]|uniref:Uncharacterized protein n=1 Tax=Crepidotus variabilis TaxID=179855 RepID=A0A9P6JNY3_9AGAR|nr:hypothetical protein CPB83DRAFT_369912 [Crepidotus variabilis]
MDSYPLYLPRSLIWAICIVTVVQTYGRIANPHLRAIETLHPALFVNSRPSQCSLPAIHSLFDLPLVSFSQQSYFCTLVYLDFASGLLCPLCLHSLYNFEICSSIHLSRFFAQRASCWAGASFLH